MDCIKLNNIQKHYGSKHVLKGLNLHIKQGAIYGLLGPNGSGKTTTIRVINGLCEKENGSIYLNEKEILNMEEKEINKSASVLTENAGNYETLTAMENLYFFGSLYNLSEEEINKVSFPLLKKLEIFDVKDAKVKTYSTGMKKRLNLVRALLPNPSILFLDEPTSGLDPETSELVNKLLLEINKLGTTIILCTHQLSYAEQICTEYGFIKNGRLLAEGSYEELLKRFDDAMYLNLKLSSYPDWISSLGSFANDILKIKVTSEKDVATLIKNIVVRDVEIYNASLEKKSLSELYFNIIEGGEENESCQ